MEIKALTFIHSVKKQKAKKGNFYSALRKLRMRFPSFELKRSVYVFPQSAERELKAVIANFKSKRNRFWLLPSEFAEEAFAPVMQKWLAGRRMRIEIFGEKFACQFMKELALLREWARAGVAEIEEREFRQRADALLREAGKIKQAMFECKIREELAKHASEFEGLLENIKRSASEFAKKREGLKQLAPSGGFSQFREKALAALKERGMGVNEIVRKLGVPRSTAFGYLERMRRGWLIKRFEKKGRRGRPRMIYDMKQTSL